MPRKKREPAPTPAKGARARAPRKVVQIPKLVGCPICGLPVQQGDNPDGLAFHDCDYVRTSLARTPATLEGIRQSAYNRLRDALPSASPVDIIKILAQLDELEGVGRRRKSSPSEEDGEKGDDVRSFVRAKVPKL